MNGINLDVFEDTEIEIDLRRCPANQVGVLLEFVRFDCFLDYVYLTLLKRKPDREGQVYYRDLVRKGISRPAIVRRLLRSSEFRVSSVEAVGLTVDEFVNRAYMDILGRWPDQDGLDTYRRIASKLNGRRRVLADLRASGEAVRKGGGRLARIEILRSYAMAGWTAGLPVVGKWFARRHRLRQRLDRIALNQNLLAQQVARLREEVEAVSLAGTQMFGFVKETSVDGQTQSEGMATSIFHNALTRARRET